MALADDPRARDVVDAFQEATGIAIGDLPGVSDVDLQANALAQPLVCATALASFAVLRHALPEPAVFAGYSIGELAAYGCAGWLSAEDTLRLAVVRATAMDAAFDAPMAMGAVRGLDHSRLAALLEDRVAYVAIRNGFDRFVVGGRADAVRSVLGDSSSAGGGVTTLGVHIASHTPLMRPAVEPFRRALEKSSLTVGEGRILAGIDGTPVLTRARALETLSLQLEHTVDWAACMRGLREAGVDTALEMPTGSDLSRLVREHDQGIQARAVSEFASLDGLINWIDRRVQRQD